MQRFIVGQSNQTFSMNSQFNCRDEWVCSGKVWDMLNYLKMTGEHEHLRIEPDRKSSEFNFKLRYFSMRFGTMAANMLSLVPGEQFLLD